MFLGLFDDGLVVVIGYKEVDEILFRHYILLRKSNSAELLFIHPACDSTWAIACKRGNFLGKQDLFIVVLQVTLKEKLIGTASRNQVNAHKTTLPLHYRCGSIFISEVTILRIIPLDTFMIISEIVSFQCRAVFFIE